MELVDFLIRNQLALFVPLAIVAVIVFVVLRLFAPEPDAFDYVPYHAFQGNMLQVQALHPLKLLSLLKKFSKREFVIFALVVFGAIATLGFTSPVPQSAALTLPDPQRDLADNKKLLIFIHGWDGDPVNTWQKFPALVQGDPAYAGFNVLVISYPTFFARRNLGVRDMARWINEELEEKGVYDRYQQIWLISHSMGGLIARELLIANRLRRTNAAYRLSVEIATPHRGAAAGALANALGVSRGFTDDLSPGSPFLKTMRDDWNQLTDRPRTFCLSSPQDAVVSDDSATAQCDYYVLYPQWGHIDMVKPNNRSDVRYSVPMSKILPNAS